MRFKISIYHYLLIIICLCGRLLVYKNKLLKSVYLTISFSNNTEWANKSYFRITLLLWNSLTFDNYLVNLIVLDPITIH